MPGVGEGWSEGGEGALTGAGRAGSRRGCGGTLQWRGGRSVHVLKAMGMESG